MRIIARVENGDASLVAEMRARGIPVVPVRGAVRITPPFSDAKEHGDTTVVIIPEIENAPLAIRVAEEGGLAHEPVIVVSGFSGKRIRTVEALRNPAAGRKQAYFVCNSGLVTIRGGFASLVVAITQHHLRRDGDRAWIEETKLWRGHYADLPRELAQYESAVLAEQGKAFCRGCVHVHYAEM